MSPPAPPSPLLAHLHDHRVGVLFAGDAALNVRFVIDPAGGGVAIPVHHSAAAGDQTLMVPEESDQSLQLLLGEPHELDPDGELADRYAAYHGRPREPVLGLFAIQSGRLGSTVADGEELMRPNPLSEAEPRLCRMANADRPRLARLCARAAGVAPAEAVMVGIDPMGIDVRARFGIVRIGLDRPVESADAAAEVLREMLEQAP